MVKLAPASSPSALGTSYLCGDSQTGHNPQGSGAGQGPRGLNHVLAVCEEALGPLVEGSSLAPRSLDWACPGITRRSCCVTRPVSSCPGGCS